MIQQSFPRWYITFHIVAEQFCIPFNGILGSEYLLETKARLNFETKQFTVGKRSIKFKQNEKLPFELKIIGIKILQIPYPL